jgi:hypothetical protein
MDAMTTATLSVISPNSINLGDITLNIPGTQLSHTQTWDISLIIAIIAATTAILSTIITAYITNRNTRAVTQTHKNSADLDFRKNVLSKNRQDWINTLRDELRICFHNIWTCFHSKESMKSHDDYTKEGYFTHLRNINLSRYKIILLANPEETDHSRLLEMLKRLESIVETKHTNKENFDPESKLTGLIFFELLDSAVHLAQEILKREWERVKKGE